MGRGGVGGGGAGAVGGGRTVKTRAERIDASLEETFEHLSRRRFGYRSVKEACEQGYVFTRGSDYLTVALFTQVFRRCGLPVIEVSCPEAYEAVKLYYIFGRIDLDSDANDISGGICEAGEVEIYAHALWEEITGYPWDDQDPETVRGPSRSP